ncbi:hypothetical protein JXB02_04010 [Candidatus Woesearchaeota archaeon]|nr:hypothetical protein [Candidatus Woesearchaeota archaeon]
MSLIPPAYAKHLDERRALVGIMVIAALALLIPTAVRLVAFDGMPPGGTSYYSMRMAGHLLTAADPSWDPLSYQGRPYIYNPYHFLLAGIAPVANPGIISLMLPPLLGIVAAFLFLVLLRRLGIELETRFVVSLLLILSPLFISVFTQSTRMPLLVVLMLGAASLYLSERQALRFLGISLFALIPLFGLVHTIAFLLLLIVHHFANRDRLPCFLSALAIVVAGGALYQFSLVSYVGLSGHSPFAGQNLLSSIVSDLGSEAGFGVFNMLLALIGIVIIWRKKRQYRLFYILLLALVAVALLFGREAHLYLAFVFAFLGGVAFVTLAGRNWEAGLIRNLTLGIIVCGVLFSPVSYLNRTSTMPPTPEMADALAWLGRNAEPDSVVLSHYSRGHWVTYFAGLPVVMDSNVAYAPQAAERYADSAGIFSSRSLETTRALLDRWYVDYIFIDPEMKHGLVWRKDDEGLLFLFRNNETFKNVYENHDVQVWQMLRG